MAFCFKCDAPATKEVVAEDPYAKLTIPLCDACYAVYELKQEGRDKLQLQYDREMQAHKFSK